MRPWFPNRGLSILQPPSLPTSLLRAWTAGSSAALRRYPVVSPPAIDRRSHQIDRQGLGAMAEERHKWEGQINLHAFVEAGQDGKAGRYQRDAQHDLARSAGLQHPLTRASQGGLRRQPKQRKRQSGSHTKRDHDGGNLGQVFAPRRQDRCGAEGWADTRAPDCADQEAQAELPAQSSSRAARESVAEPSAGRPTAAANQSCSLATMRSNRTRTSASADADRT